MALIGAAARKKFLATYFQANRNRESVVKVDPTADWFKVYMSDRHHPEQAVLFTGRCWCGEMKHDCGHGGLR